MLFSLLIRLLVLPLATRRMNFGALMSAETTGAKVVVRITVVWDERLVSH
jgi:hypothetical protein